ncbi:MAG: metalloregulator ArsR/SmtB family transcription factor [Ignavibacteriota bacterium]
MNEIRRDVFQAISDPVRRGIILLLSENKLTLNGVTENFKISRPAISKHVRILEECGLVTINQQGRERYCVVNPEPLNEVYDWLSYFDRFWDKKLNSLKTLMEKKK